MQVFNNLIRYGLLAKLFHWITFLALIVQIPFGFYLVGLEFSERRIDLENIHILIGISVFYLVVLRLLLLMRLLHLEHPKITTISGLSMGAQFLKPREVNSQRSRLMGSPKTRGAGKLLSRIRKQHT